MRKALLCLCAFLLFGRLASAAPCPVATVSPNRANHGSKYDLLKVRHYLNNPTPEESERLILVTAHRGDWEVCPENTIEGAMVAMDKQAELIELDIRISKDGVPYLAHDWDFRGEAVQLAPNLKDSTVNNVYLLTSKTLQEQKRVKIDRFGDFAKDANGNYIAFPTLEQFLEVYRQRAALLQGQEDLAKYGIRQGAEIVLDIKGSDGAPMKTVGKGASQLEALRNVLKTVHNFEEGTKVSLENALVYKVNLKAMVENEADAPKEQPILPTRLRQIVRESGIRYDIGLIFIVYPENWNIDGGSRAFYEKILNAYRDEYGKLIFGVDWQSRFPGINLEPFQKEDVKMGRGVGAFVAYNPFPEGIRRSEGTCTFRNDNIQVTATVSWKWGPPCLAQGIMQWSSAALEFFFPPKDLHIPVFATNITTDMYENARNYLEVTGRREINLIQWKKGDGLADATRSTSEPTTVVERSFQDRRQVFSAAPAVSNGGEVSPVALQKGTRAMDLILVRSSECKNQIKDIVLNICLSSPAITAKQEGTYFSIDGQAAPEGWITKVPWIFGPGQARQGFTVAVELDTRELEHQQQITNVFTVVAPYSGQPLFSVQRGADGAWYAGKQIDRTSDQPQSFNTKLWDPVSPCVPDRPDGRRCIQDTLYVSFQSTGEVRLDDIAVLADGNGRKSIDWRSGLMNYGLPVVTYQPGVPANADFPNWPTAKPDFMDIGGVGLAALGERFYGANNLYRNNKVPYSGARLKRFTIWAGGMIGKEEIVQQDGGKWTNLTNIFRNVEKAIIADHNNRQLSAVANDNDRQKLTTLMPSVFLPCNTGQFQYNIPSQDLNAINSTTQYRPSAATPCNPTGNVIPDPSYSGTVIDVVTEIP